MYILILNACFARVSIDASLTLRAAGRWVPAGETPLVCVAVGSEEVGELS